MREIVVTGRPALRFSQCCCLCGVWMTRGPKVRVRAIKDAGYAHLEGECRPRDEDTDYARAYVVTAEQKAAAAAARSLAVLTARGQRIA